MPGQHANGSVVVRQEFAAFARARDVVEKRKEAFELPYAIDGDRVGGLTIKLIFNKLDRWTKALKYMLSDLKWALKCESDYDILLQLACRHHVSSMCILKSVIGWSIKQHCRWRQGLVQSDKMGRHAVQG